MMYTDKKYLDKKKKPIRMTLVIGDEVQYDETGNTIYLPEKSVFIDELIDWHLERLEKMSKVKFRPYLSHEDDIN